MPGPVSPAIPRAAAQGCCVRSTGSCPRPALGAPRCPYSQVPGGGEAVSSAGPKAFKAVLGATASVAQTFTCPAGTARARWRCPHGNKGPLERMSPLPCSSLRCVPRPGAMPAAPQTRCGSPPVCAPVPPLRSLACSARGPKCQSCSGAFLSAAAWLCCAVSGTSVPTQGLNPGHGSGSPQSEPLNCQGAPSGAFPSCSAGWWLLWDLERVAAQP